MIQSTIRYLIALAVAYLVGHGVITADQGDTILPGLENAAIVIATGAGLLFWSWAEKYFKGWIDTPFIKSILSRTPSSVNHLLLVLAAGAACALSGCATDAGTVIYNDVINGLHAIEKSAQLAKESGLIPAGKASDAVADTNTTANMLETVVTGKAITQSQIDALAASWKMDTATTNWVTIGLPIVQQLIDLTNSLLSRGADSETVKEQQVQLLVHAPTTVEQVLTTPSS